MCRSQHEVAAGQRVQPIHLDHEVSHGVAVRVPSDERVATHFDVAQLTSMTVECGRPNEVESLVATQRSVSVDITQMDRVFA